MTPFRPSRLALAALPLLLAACAVQRPPAQAPAPTPAGWHAPVPHQGSVADLARWWELHADPLLGELVRDAQALSPTVAQASAQLAQARAQQVAARAALLPALDAQANASRGFNEQVGGIATVAQAGLQAGWEIDLFGRNAAVADAARERLAGARAQWHEARVSVAAEVALQYSGWHHCMRQLAVAQADARSRGETARLAQESERAGFTAPATAALATASHADALGRAAQQRLQCEIDVKTLVALTGRAEPALRAQLAAAPPLRPQDALFAIDSLPAQTLAQRPDVYAAEREVASASAEVGDAQAQRLPRVTLSGSIGRGLVRSGGVEVTSNTWSIGPVAVTLPLFDGGRRAGGRGPRTLRQRRAALPRPGAPGRGRGRTGAGAPGQYRRPQRRCAPRGRRLPPLVRGHAGALDRRHGQPGGAGGCAPHAARLRDRAGRARAGVHGRVDRPLSRRRRRLDK
jgi:NodT family efflux transporter outer membrane factor (OMF) lipoprotein